MRRFTSGGLIALLLLLLVPVAAPAAQAQEFSDLANHWAAASISQGARRGYVRGYPDGTFHPDAPVTRAELLKMALAAAGVQVQTSPPPQPLYPDLPVDHWLVQSGYANPTILGDAAAMWGIPSGEPLGVGQTATRAEAAALIANLAGSYQGQRVSPTEAAADLLAFADLRDWQYPGRSWVGQAVHLGIARGFPDGSFGPERSLSRAEAVVMLEHLLALPVAPVTPQVTGGMYSSFFLKPDGTLWSWGANEFAELGNGLHRSRATPGRVVDVPRITAIAAGDLHVLALAADGTVWAWGESGSGQTGSGQTPMHQPHPGHVVGLTDVKAVAADRSYSVAVRQDGTVWEWGHTSQGKVVKPRPVSGLDGIAAVAAGDGHALALRTDGTVWVWGEHDLGLDTAAAVVHPVQMAQLPRAIAVAARSSQSIVLTADGHVWTWGSGSWGAAQAAPAPVSDLDGVVAVSAGSLYLLAEKSDGTLWVWTGATPASGVGPVAGFSPTPRQVPGLGAVAGFSAAPYHGLALDRAGRLWAWGRGTEGQLGAASYTFSYATPTLFQMPGTGAVAAAFHNTLLLHRDGTVWTYGFGDPVPRQVGGLRDIISLAPGSYPNLALRADGTVWAWGGNHHGELGNGRTDRGNVTRDAAQVENLTDVRAVSTGSFYAVAVKKDGTVWAWGANSDGQLGGGAADPQTLPVQVAGLPGDIVAVAAGRFDALALTAAGQVWTWGKGSPEHKPALVSGLAHVKEVASAGVSSTMLALRDDGTVWAWGSNAYGLPGDVAGAERRDPVQVKGLQNIAHIVAGRDMALGIDTAGSVWVWGANRGSQLGVPATTSTLGTPVQVPGIQGAKDAAVSYGDDDNGGHVLVLGQDDQVWAWGANRWGEIDAHAPVDEPRPIPVAMP